MIDLHTHLLPGIDDGPEDLSGSVAVAREAAQNGVTALAATPHVRDDYPTTAASMTAALEAVRKALRDAGVAIEALPGAEISFDWLARLDQQELRAFGLGGSASHLLVEMPVFGWPLNAKEEIRRMREAGFTTVLAHPERNVVVQASTQRLLELVRDGALVQVTAGSLLGNFGGAAKRAARALLAADLVHLLATDTHSAPGRGAALLPALETLNDPALSRWLTFDVPQAIIEGAPCPRRPSAQRNWWRRRSGRRIGLP